MSTFHQRFLEEEYNYRNNNNTFEEDDEGNDTYFQEDESTSPVNAILNVSTNNSEGRINSIKASDESFSQYFLQHTNSTSSSVIFHNDEEEEQGGSFESMYSDNCSSGSIMSSNTLQAATKKKKQKRSSYSSTSMNSHCGICFGDYLPYLLTFSSSSFEGDRDSLSRTMNTTVSTSSSSTSFASSNGGYESTPTSSPVKRLSSRKDKKDTNREEETIKVPKPFRTTDLQHNHDNMKFDSSEKYDLYSRRSLYDSFDSTSSNSNNDEKRSNQQRLLLTESTYDEDETTKSHSKPPKARRNSSPMNTNTMTPTKNTISSTASSTTPRRRRKPSNTDSKNLLATPPRYPNATLSTPPRPIKLSTLSSESFKLPSPTSMKFTPKSNKIRAEHSKTEMSCSNLFSPASLFSLSYDEKRDLEDVDITKPLQNSQLNFTLPSYKNNDKNKSITGEVTHNIQDLDEEEHLIEDDDCTVRMSNMQSTQYNKIHYGTPPMKTRKTSLQSNDDICEQKQTTTKEDKLSIIINNEGIETNQVLYQLRKEWEVEPPQKDVDNAAIFEAHCTKNHERDEQKKKTLMQKTSKKVKKMLKRNKDTNRGRGDSRHGDTSVVSDDAAVAGDASTQHERSASSLSSQQFADLWLKKIMDGEEIFLNHSKENILLGTPLQIGMRDAIGSNGSNRKAKKTSGNVRSPLKVKKSQSFSFGTKQNKVKRVGSDILNKVGTPTRKFATMMTNLKHRHTLSNQSNILLSKDDGPSPSRLKSTLYRAIPTRTKDDAIKGRLDGIDVISLGSCRCVSYIGSKDKALAGQRYTLRSMVSDTIWATLNVFPEMVLEGFAPNGNDRWTVLIEEDSSSDDVTSMRQKVMRQRNKMKKQSHKSSIRSNRENGDDENYSSKLIPTPLLMTQIWGKEGPPPPTNSLQFERADHEYESKPGCGLRALSSCPINSEKDIFLIQESDHLHSVHSFAVVPLKYGKFDESITIFTKILRSLEHKFERTCGDHHLIGACHHNLGVIHMWSGNYEESLVQFKKAVAIRRQTLTSNHPSVAVSLSKLGLAYFALEQLDKALETFEKALETRKKVLQHDTLEIAKILNNIATVHYQKGDSKTAMKKLNEALNIMKQFMEGPIRRESIVYDTSVILSNMGKIHLERKKFEMAYLMLEEALMVQTSTFKIDHDCILACLGNLAHARSMEGQTNKALQIYKSLFRIQIKKFGRTSSEVTETKGMMSLLYIQLGQYKEAHRCLKDVKTWQKHNLDQHHPALTNTKNTIRKLKEAIKGANESFALV